jgi:small subunit ribosomal protein S19
MSLPNSYGCVSPVISSPDMPLHSGTTYLPSETCASRRLRRLAGAGRAAARQSGPARARRVVAPLAMRATAAALARSVWKGPFADPLQALPHGVWRGTRRSMILPDWVGRAVEVHNGRRWAPVSIVEDMIGHRLGEFSPTRKKSPHKAVLLRQRMAQKKSKKT